MADQPDTEHQLADASRAIASQRQIVVSTCRWCSKEIRGLKVKKFCDGTCQRASHRDRQRWARRGDGTVPGVDEYYGPPETYAR